MRQVGTRCLRDFLDGHDVKTLCRHAESELLARQALTAASVPARESAPDASTVPLDKFAAHAARAVRTYGWVSRALARRSSRPASAHAALQTLQSEPHAPDAADLALARGALRWARELLAAKPQLSNFERDAVAVVNKTTLPTRREHGLVCALIEVYRGRRLRSEHLGVIGEWLETVVLVERHAQRPSERHGIVCRHDLVDVDGNRLVWWQTRGAPLPLDQAIHLRGRVQRHTYFGHTAVTALIQCRVLDRKARHWFPGHTCASQLANAPASKVSREGPPSAP